MKIERAVMSSGLDAIGNLARQAELVGYEGLWVAETNHDPFLRVLAAAVETERLSLGTVVAVAFARSPMVTALSAWDLQVASEGRFILGLGTQVKPHIERRYSMPWSHPVPRMGEYVGALRAIFDTWQSGSALNFRGTYYTHTLMTPAFDPGPIPTGPPPIFLAAVGRRMLRLSGEIADGVIVHPFSTKRYLSEVLIPTVSEGLTTSRRTRSSFDVVVLPIIATGENEELLDASKDSARNRIAFYASTPAYRSVLELHGLGNLQSELNALTRRGAWNEMGNLIDDDVLAEFAIVGEPQTLAERIEERFGGIADRVGLGVVASGAEWDPSGEVLEALKRVRGRDR